jgi:hypothetical protein
MQDGQWWFRLGSLSTVGKSRPLPHFFSEDVSSSVLCHAQAEESPGASGMGGWRLIIDARTGAALMDSWWSHEWFFGWRHANQPTITMSFLGGRLDTASGLAVGSSSASSFHRVDGAGDMFEAHNLILLTGGAAVVRQSANRGSMVDSVSRGLEQANVWRTAALRLRVDPEVYAFPSRLREFQTRTRPSIQEVALVVFSQGRR